MDKSVNGWLGFYKEKSISSNNFLTKVKRILRNCKMGFAGTLDPLAQGVLPIALGKATKFIDILMRKPKTYRFILDWRGETISGDTEYPITVFSTFLPDKQSVQKAVEKFYGKIYQNPPIFSAKKINGQKACDLARKGLKVDLNAKEIEIFSFKMLERLNEFQDFFEVSCSSGTYVRSLGIDLATTLATKAHLTFIERTEVGIFTKENVKTLDFFQKLDYDGALGLVRSTSDILDDILDLAVDYEDSRRLSYGQAVVSNGFFDGEFVVSCQGQVLGLGEVCQGLLKMKKFL